jgi:hypothetical protein
MDGATTISPTPTPTPGKKGKKKGKEKGKRAIMSNRVLDGIMHYPL